MNTSRLSLISVASDSDAAAPGFSRGIVLAAIVVAIFLSGIAMGRAFAPESSAPMAEAQVSAPQPSQEFVYFPSQYVNQGAEVPESTSTF